MQTLPPNLCWGCLGETMLLTLEREVDDYSIGGKLSLRQADYIAALADKHGFEPAEPQWYGDARSPTRTSTGSRRLCLRRCKWVGKPAGGLSDFVTMLARH